MKTPLSYSTLLAAVLATCLHAADPAPAAAQSAAHAERDARMAWWREARFGMFVHWGLYSGLGGTWDGKKVSDDGKMEWIQHYVGADAHSYAAQAFPRFQPTPDFAKSWARLAKEAGCQYVVFTTKHHDGYALHDSKWTQYDAGDLLDRDLVREICDALRAEGLKVGFYHSVIDWHHPQYDFTRSKILAYPERGREIAVTPRNHDRYIEFLHNQVDELTSNYGPVDVLWWDYSSTDFQGDAAWRAMELMANVRAKQPKVIMNNRLFRIPEAGFSGMGMDDITGSLDPQYGDFITPEQFIPATGLQGVDWESCMTMNTGWGYNEHDHNWKSAEEIVRNLIDIASKGGNYLLNIGPKGDGSIPTESVTRMNEVGVWMKENAEAIYGTTASPLEKTPFDGRITTKGKIHYAHVFTRPESGQIELPFQIEKATLAAGGSRLEIRANGTQSVIMLPAKLPNPIATVIRLE